MSVITENKRQAANAGVLLGFLLLGSLLAVKPAWATFTVPLKSIAQISIDDDGNHLGYPTSLFFDPTEDEIYVVNQTERRVVVYGPDYFPRLSIGASRGVYWPLGGEVEANGDVYICQNGTKENPSRRITVLNGAFFVDREISLEKIPEAVGLVPRNVAVSSDGTMYIAGNDYRGVLVLDNQGNFLRRLQPKDKVLAITLSVEASEKESAKKEAEEGKQEQPKEEDNLPDIPEEFRPRSTQQGQPAGPGNNVAPVKIDDMTIDSNGRLYLLSQETGKVYVYGPDENFLFSFGHKGGSPGQLAYPKGVAVDDNRGLIYVVDYMRHTIVVFDLNGKWLFEVGGRGAGPGWFNYPEAIAINKHGQLVVADLFNKRVQVLEVEYENPSALTKSITAPDGAAKPPDSEGVAKPAGPGSEPEQEAEPEPSDAGIKEVVFPDKDQPVQIDATPDVGKQPESGEVARPDGVESKPANEAESSDMGIKEVVFPDKDPHFQIGATPEEGKQPDSTPAKSDSGSP